MRKRQTNNETGKERKREAGDEGVCQRRIKFFGNIDNVAFFRCAPKVYDVTKFLDEHPGGRDQLLVGVGRDASVVFDSYHKETTLK